MTGLSLLPSNCNAILLAMTPQQIKRNCQPCTACCDGHLLLDSQLQPNHGQSCTNCTSAGCAIYENRPRDPCQTFECLWLMQDSPFPDWMRPDLSRVLVNINTLKWNSTPIAVALQLDWAIDKKVVDYFKRWSMVNELPLALMKPDVGKKVVLGANLELLSC
jgi:hypothetical protein